ncbi:uncharacterized protein TNCV_4092701 [Trichonephila clavipes]|nr:uncharacterized protein TNCV_4092701 [Trichonephila clavipes]
MGTDTTHLRASRPLESSSDSSDHMEFSPTKFKKVSACEKLRDIYRYRYLNPSQVDLRDGRTFTQPQEFLHRLVHIEHTGHDQEEMAKSDKDFEFYILKRQKDKPIKAVIKGLPNSSKINDITNDLKVKVEGYLVRGITQCFNCNNFYHKAANCVLKCGKDHATRNCHIKERQENPFCINCQDFGHSACYTKCPKFPQPKKGTDFSDPIKRKKISSKWTKEGISFANVVSGEIPSQTSSETESLTANKKEDSSSGFLTQDNNSSDFSQVLELFNTISNLVKKNPKILDLLSKFKTANSDEEKTCLQAEALMNKI